MNFCSDWVNIESMAAKIKKCVIFGKCAISELNTRLHYCDMTLFEILLFYPILHPINKIGVSMAYKLSFPCNDMK